MDPLLTVCDAQYRRQVPQPVRVREGHGALVRVDRAPREGVCRQQQQRQRGRHKDRRGWEGESGEPLPSPSTAVLTTTNETFAYVSVGAALWDTRESSGCMLSAARSSCCGCVKEKEKQ